ncbi:MAG TPA: nucleotidyltransferase family protein [Candidatus Acidoferrales bacterium]|nr:nucleotidyltransferase family protein [Candidatus Acidoferrales bacterium]
MLAAVILAAGESRRMGSPKALLTYEGRPFLEHLLEVTRHPKVGLTRVVLGANAEEIGKHFQLDSATLVVNPEWERGQLSSLQAAVRSLPDGGTDGILLCLVDHPLVTPTLVGELVEKFYSSGKLIVLPTFEARRGHPVIISSRLYQELLDAPRETGARSVVWAHSQEVLEVPTSEQGVVLNLNDPDALRKALGKP